MWPTSPETVELLQQARQGDAAAVEQLLQRHREPVRRLIGLRMDPAIAARLDASDVVQEVLLEASKRLGDYLRDGTMPCDGAWPQSWTEVFARWTESGFQP